MKFLKDLFKPELAQVALSPVDILGLKEELMLQNVIILNFNCIYFGDLSLHTKKVIIELCVTGVWANDITKYVLNNLDVALPTHMGDKYYIDIIHKATFNIQQMVRMYIPVNEYGTVLGWDKINLDTATILRTKM